LQRGVGKETRDAHRRLAKVKYYYEAGSQGARVTYTNRRSIQKERERGKRKHEGEGDHEGHWANT